MLGVCTELSILANGYVAYNQPLDHSACWRWVKLTQWRCD